MKTRPEPAEFLLYQTEDGETRLEVAFRGETCWLSLNQLAELFQRDKSVISRHIKNLFEEGELMHEATVAKFATVQTEGAKTVHRQIVENRVSEKWKSRKGVRPIFTIDESAISSKSWISPRAVPSGFQRF